MYQLASILMPLRVCGFLEFEAGAATRELVSFLNRLRLELIPTLSTSIGLFHLLYIFRGCGPVTRKKDEL